MELQLNQRGPRSAARATTWVAAALLALAGCREEADGSCELRDLDHRLATAATGSAVVRHVIDGDTVELEDGTRVRILLVDAPEATRSTE